MSYSSGTAASTGDEPYWLGRASEEQQRLIKQHDLYIKSIGYLLHPSAKAKLPENARIADVATGTGIWLKDLADVSPPTYSFEGFDISNEQFLSADNLPSNVKLGFLDFKKPIPEELRGQFDLVNIRLIIISLGPLDAWKTALTNILTLLKPGGVITWTEGNFLVARGFRGASAKSTSGHALTAAQLQLNTTLTNRFGYSFPDFTSLFSDAGLQSVETDDFYGNWYRCCAWCIEEPREGGNGGVLG
ncbi:S-adenosyl-L-methionine-dependent methyltransferase [Pyrenochaeta sp. MPI-SDFR-AT-0127]|nr:S-adenosyl-L-methionine-dependent methyltransferase [Pyrenochaeta sp. MPI-SDFR-AT-0127]